MNPLQTIANPWSKAQKYMLRVGVLFVALFIFSFPLEMEYFPDVGAFMRPMFESMAHFFAESIFGIEQPFVSDLISDSTGAYVHTFVLFLFSLLVAVLWTRWHRNKHYDAKMLYWFTAVMAYYLGFMLLHYGFNKVFKWQFYLPEPNTLYTTVGETSKDLLYWSSMGSSRFYSMFMGWAEVVAGGMLFFRKTRTLGALFSFAVLVNVVMVNIGFDINVKLFSMFLLLLSVLILGPHFRRMYRFFIRNEGGAHTQWFPTFKTKQGRWMYAGIKTATLCIILFASLAMYFNSGNFNDDAAPRPLFHGAYEVIQQEAAAPLQWKRVFVHRKFYMIFQNQNDEMFDYEMAYDTVNHQLVLHDYYRDQQAAVLHYEQPSDSILHLSGEMFNSPVKYELQQLNLENLPLLKDEFGWRLEDFF